jgi:crossover junction endodeoxyribonuclease RuvC
VFEYSALEIKQATVGYGRAQKNQVAEMCRVLLGLREVPKPHDAADALAAAICHLHSRQHPEPDNGSSS